MSQLIIEITLTSLLSVLTVFIIALLLRLHLIGKSLDETLLGRKTLVIFLLTLLILLVPVMLSSLRGAWLSPEELAVYVRELLVSVVIVVSFSLTWKLLDHSTSILRPFAKIYTSAKYVIGQSIDYDTPKVHIEIPSLNDALQAWECNEISKGVVKEAQLLESLNKWLFQKDETGWIELQEDIGRGNTLPYLSTRMLVEQEIWHYQKKRKLWGRLVGNGKYERLISLLPPQPMENHHAT